MTGDSTQMVFSKSLLSQQHQIRLDRRSVFFDNSKLLIFIAMGEVTHLILTVLKYILARKVFPLKSSLLLPHNPLYNI